MNLSISPVNIKSNNNVSFGMAELNKYSYGLARACSDTCNFLKDSTDFQDPRFFDKKKFLRKPPFVKYMEDTLPSKDKVEPEVVDEVAQAIVECGATRNSFSNARFTRQLLASRSHFETLHADVKKPISDAVAAVFITNWDNPELTKQETFDLLEMAKGSFNDKQYVTLTGVIEKSDDRGPKPKKGN